MSIPFLRRVTLSTAVLLSIFSISGEPQVFAKEATQMTTELLQQLEHDKFTELKSVSDLPKSVKDFYLQNRDGKDIQEVMADHGEKWQSGCVQKPGGAPSKSFLVAAKSDGLCLVYSQSGGFVLLDQIEIFSLPKSGHAEKLWSSSMFKDHPENASQLVAAATERIKNPIK